MNYFKGLDIGNKWVKLPDGTMFPSTLKRGHMFMNSDVHNVEWKGNKYTVGDPDGEINTAPDKVETEHYQILLLTAIAVSIPDLVIDIAIVTGMPIDSYDSLSVKFYNTIMEMGNQTITVDGKKKTININACRIYPESCFPYLDEKKYSTLKTFVIDIGGGTVNCSMWDGVNLKAHKSFPNATISILQSIAEQVAEKHSVVVDAEKIDYIMEDGVEEYYGEDEVIQIKDLKKAVFEDYTRELAKSIKSKFKAGVSMGASDSIKIIGGASIPLKEYLLKELVGFKDKIEIDPEPQTVNLRIYDALAKLYFSDKSKGNKQPHSMVAAGKVD